jgi:hypothetical protein
MEEAGERVWRRSMAQGTRVERKGGLERWVPGLRTLREYRHSWLLSGLVAGLVPTALLEAGLAQAHP